MKIILKSNLNQSNDGQNKKKFNLKNDKNKCFEPTRVNLQNLILFGETIFYLII
jgi:hypothetical protein